MIAVQGNFWGRGPALGARRALHLLFLGLLGLSACALDKEGTVRAQLNGWVVLRDTLYFKSTRDCTAAQFSTGAGNTLSGVRKASSIDRGLRLIRQGDTVAFDIADMSPAEIQSAIDGIDRSVSLAILASGLAARDCYASDLKDSFSKALFGKKTMLIYDPTNNAVALFDRAQKQVFFTRAEL